MENIQNGDESVRRRRQESVSAIRGSVRELAVQLPLLNHQVGRRLGIRSVDFDCLNVIQQQGPFGAAALSRLTGLHPATMTGVLDRLQAAGWIAREADPTDRRAVAIRALPDRLPSVLALFAGMSRSMNRILATYGDAELEVLASFVQQTAAAARGAATELSTAPSDQGV